jgi:hypothetical protein
VEFKKQHEFLKGKLTYLDTEFEKLHNKYQMWPNKPSRLALFFEHVDPDKKKFISDADLAAMKQPKSSVLASVEQLEEPFAIRSKPKVVSDLVGQMLTVADLVSAKPLKSPNLSLPNSIANLPLPESDEPPLNFSPNLDFAELPYDDKTDQDFSYTVDRVLSTIPPTESLKRNLLSLSPEELRDLDSMRDKLKLF